MNASTTEPVPSPAAAMAVVSWQLPCHPRTVGRGRANFREQAAVWGLEAEPTETAALLLSELLTNAVCHAHAPGRDILVRCLLLPAALRVEVSDAGDGVPVLREAAPDAQSGRGLALIAALASAWSADPRPHGIGKTVWFELTLRAACES